jgi:hypothetical protein
MIGAPAPVLFPPVERDAKRPAAMIFSPLQYLTCRQAEMIRAVKRTKPALETGDLRPAWLITVLVIALVDTLGNWYVYLQLRAIIEEHLPDGRAIYLYSVSYYACLFWLLFWIQRWFV